jgi:hypothetical protein
VERSDAPCRRLGVDGFPQGFVSVYALFTRGGIAVKYKIPISLQAMHPMFTTQLTQAGHTRRFSVERLADDGWEVRVEQDSQIVRQVRYTDWRRVERAVLRIEQEVQELHDLGWRDSGAQFSSMNR